MNSVPRPGDSGKWEVVRRLRYGALIKLFRHRYGHEFPDDDAGRADLKILLYVVSLAPYGTDKKLADTIAMWAPWMPEWERELYVEHVNRLTIYERMPAAKILGEELNLTNAERERLRLWPIMPVDMTVEQLMEQRKFKDRERQKQRRRSLGAKPKSVAARPWEQEGIARSTYYARKRRTPTSRVKTPTSATIVIKQRTNESSTLQGESLRRGLHGSGESERRREVWTIREVERQEPSGSSDVRTFESNDPRMAALNNWGGNLKRRLSKNSFSPAKKGWDAFDTSIPWCPLEALPL
jgi:hypothetical protein